MQNKLHYQVPWFSFIDISLRTSWPLCKSPCDSFVLQNVGSAETPNSAFGNVLSVIFHSPQWDQGQPFSCICIYLKWGFTGSLPQPHSEPWGFPEQFSSTQILPLTLYSVSFTCINLNEKLFLYCIECSLSLSRTYCTLYCSYIYYGLFCVVEHFWSKFQYLLQS